MNERNTTEAAALAPAAFEGTHRLGTLMKTQALAIQDGRRWRRRFAAAIALALLVGAGAAILLRKPFVLDAATDAEMHKVEREKNAEEQYLLAVELANEPAWKSVEKYFPKDPVYVPRANQQLARFYEQHDRWADALKLFQKFANYPDVERSYKAFGLAGECVVYSIEKNPQESARAGLELSKISGGLEPAKLDPLLDRQMVAAVGTALRKTKTLLSTAQNAEWDKWLDSHFHDESAQ